MGNKGYSKPDIWGDYLHYDSDGHKIGRSRQNVLGDYTNYDAEGRKIGRTVPNWYGGYDHYDTEGNKIGHSEPGVLGNYRHYDAKGKQIGSSNPDAFGGYSHTGADGCYIATCVYGSYDAPEVWTLRRFRDCCLGKSIWGRAFIYAYYALSPRLVAAFGEALWFQRFGRNMLNCLVSRLQAMGYENSPYADIDWRNRK